MPVSPLLTAAPPNQLTLQEIARPARKTNSFFTSRKSVQKFAINSARQGGK
jgi:hypothetical protein